MTKTYVPTRAEKSKMTASVSMVTEVKCCNWMFSLNKCWVVLWVVFGLMFTAGIKQLSAMQPPLQSVGGDSYVKLHSFLKLFITTVSHEGKESRLFDKKPVKFNSVWLPLVDVVEYSVVFAPKVFVQSFGVSCHCGLQSTVVHSRVRQLQLLDLQRNWWFVHCSIKSVFLEFCSIFSSSRHETPQHKLWGIIYFLFVPEQIRITALKCTVKCNCVSFSSNDISCWLGHCVFSFTLWGRTEHAEEEMNQ